MALSCRRSLRSAAAALLLVTHSACGGNEEAGVQSETTRARVATTSVTESTRGAEAPPGSVDEPNVFLDVTNQSYDDPDVHITISVSGRPFVDQNFPVKGQHHIVGFALSLAPGEHELEVTSDTGVNQRVPVFVSEDEPVYLHLAYWDIGDEDPYFAVAVQDEPFGYG